MNFLLSKENFIKIYYQKTKKGKPLEYCSKRLYDTNNNRDDIENFFKKVEEHISEARVEIGVAEKKVKDKQIYQYQGESLDALLIDSQIQANLKKAFRIRMPNHKEIIAQVKSLFDDNMQKYVYRTDIKSFFESIPHAELKAKISKRHKLDSFSKNTIFQILDQYATITSSRRGIPRGIGLSSYLAEVYMLDFDRMVRSWDSVFFYARFVDDIIVFSTNDVHKTIMERVKKDYKLEVNPEKNELHFYNGSKKVFEFLGYKFQKSNGNDVKITLSSQKRKKIENKVQKSIEAYNKVARQKSPKRESFAWRLLNQRLRFLTGNTRLVNTKSNVFVGIYASNSFVNAEECFSGLDKFLKYAIGKHLQSTDKNKRKIKEKYSFVQGFVRKKFHPFTCQELGDITKIWKNL